MGPEHTRNVERGCLSLDTRQGDYARYHGNGGWPGDAEDADQFLTRGQIYQVSRVIVENWSSEVVLREFPGERFNTVLFENVE